VRLDASARYPALDGSQITNLAGGSLTVGTTAIASGTSGRILYDNAGVLGELPVGTGVATALAVNVGSAGAFLTSAVTSITGTANEITVTGTTTPTLSLPTALTFTGKTVTGGTFVLPQVGYLAATFDYFGEWMTFISSTDAATWKRTHATPIVTTEGTIRDPALHYVAATGTFYVAYTRNALTGGNSWGLGSSTDGRTWTWSTISTGSLATGTPAHVWIGDWFTDSDGTDHVLFAANTTASQAAGGLYLYETHPTTPGDYSAWSTPVQITGSAITNNLGNSPAVVKVGSTYHLFYDLPSAGGIRHVTSTSLTSGFNTAGTYPSFPSTTEGPAIFTLANGTYRLYAEQNYQQSTAGLKYSDSTDLVTWGSVQSAVTQGYMGHPHGIQVTSQELLNKVSMLEQGQKNPVWSSLYDGKTAVAIGYPDINTESAFGPYGEGLTIFGGASGGSYLYVSTRNQNGAAIFTDPNASSPAGNNFYIARRSGLNYMRFDGGTNNASFYGTATFLGSTSGSATISVSATGGLLALPSGTTATNMALTTPNLGTPSAIVLTNASGTASININGTVGATTPAAGSFTTLTASATTSLLLGTAGSAVGTIGFRNATSGTTTLAPATGALGTGTVTLPLSGTLATLEGSNTYTGTTNTFTLPTTTGTTTASGIAVAANSLTTGTGADFSSTSASTTAGQVVRIAKTGAGTLNQALTLTASGGTANVALNATAGHVLVPDGSYVYNTSVSPSIGRSAVAANSINQAGLILESNSVTLLTNSIRGLVFSGYGAFGNTLLITPVGGHTTFSGTLVATAVFQAAENKTSTPNTGTFKGGDGSGTNIAGGILHIVGGASTGSAAGGSILIRTTPAGGSGSSANAAVTAITIDSTQAVTLASTLAVTGATTLTGLLTANGGITLGDAKNIAFNTTTGTKIGTATTQKLSFWNATPIVQPTTAVASATVAHTGGGTNIKTDDTFDGYTLAQVVKALRNAGLLA
jgi:hypothetical protein